MENSLVFFEIADMLYCDELKAHLLKFITMNLVIPSFINFMVSQVFSMKYFWIHLIQCLKIFYKKLKSFYKMKIV